jgi:hypothetical protein
MTEAQVTNTNYERLITMTLEDLETYQQQLQEKREKHLDMMDDFPKNQEDWNSSEWAMKHDYNEILDLLYHINLEMVIREHCLREKELSQLEEIAHDAYRKARRMQNYDWDVVEHSSPENQAGFWSNIDYLETLEAAANLEIERRNLGNK